jgi:hypothetical protein
MSFLFPYIVLLAIIGVTLAIYRLKAASDRDSEDKKRKEDCQNSIYESAKELGDVSALLHNGHIYDACKVFNKVSTQIDRLTHSDFSTIDWKNYFEQVCTTRDQLGAYLSATHPHETRKACYEAHVQTNAQERKLAKQRAWRVFYDCLPLIVTIVIILLVIVASKLSFLQ